MKYLRIILILGLCAVSQPLFADDHSMLPPDMENYIGYGAIFTVLILIVVAILVILRAV
jgi:cytochrome c oxidase cbb3-type subunit 3